MSTRISGEPLSQFVMQSWGGITGIRLWMSTMRVLGFVVSIVKLSTVSPSIVARSQRPAMKNTRRFLRLAA